MKNDGIQNNLQTLFTGRELILLKTVDSTNKYLNELIVKKSLPEGTVIMAMEQTAGRGQSTDPWLSDPDKNLLVSVLFYPSFLSTQNLFLLSKVFSLGVFDAVKTILGMDEGIKIKWPNDIYFHDRKLGGMLIENAIRNPNVNHTILGIGLNINQENFSSSLQNPVSLKTICGRDLVIRDCLSVLCNSLERRYLQLKTGNIDQMNEDYLSCLFRFGEFHEYSKNSERFKAKITAVANDGKLFLKHENGLIGKYDFKEVKFIF
jgi:BirA family biotin operon repressor/biotin-[acetyl-CoA-carboxylase] ligase